MEIAGKELQFADDNKGGATQFVSASDIAALAQKRTGPARATAATGGRLVSLVDGKEYPVPDGGVTIGRDASCGIVVAQTEVSRLHAEIVAADNGYVVNDRSTNGLLVNGTKVQGSQLLSRADIIRIGTEEFRFYADVAVARPSAATVTPPVAAPVVPAPVAPATPAALGLPPMDSSLMDLELLPPSAPAPRVPTPAASAPPPPMAPARSAPPAAPVADAAKPDTRPILAVFEVVNEGPTKGTKYNVRSPLTHVGRGAHNDIAINDESVSDTHAKIQRRDDGWYLVDAESTNGSYVGGVRIAGEKRLDGAPDVRFESVKTIFRPTDQPTADGKGTRAIASIDRTTQQQLRAQATAPMPAAASPAPATKGKMPLWVWVVVAAVIGSVVAFFAMKH
jgi:pSer/pThr/pTyr-binding forkhead associated (FHA) protein